MIASIIDRTNVVLVAYRPTFSSMVDKVNHQGCRVVV